MQTHWQTKPTAQAAIDAFNADPNRPYDLVDGTLHYHTARKPILATDCDYEIVRFSGVQGRKL